MNEKPQGERWCSLPHAPWCPRCKRERDALKAELAFAQGGHYMATVAENTHLRQERDALEAALEELASWSLPRWEPDDPQTEGEEMRLFAGQALKKLEEK